MPSNTNRDLEIVPFEEIKYVFNLAILRPGDILLMNTYHESQRKVMEYRCGFCIFDHAALYMGDAYLLEADGNGVVMNHIFSRGFKGNNDACVLRLKQANKTLLSNVIFNARALMGMEFDGNEAKLVPANKTTDKPDTSNHTFCSRLVSQCYDKEGIRFFTNPNYCTPDDFLNCDKLERIEQPLQPFTSEMELTVMNAQQQRTDYKTATYWAVPFQRFSLLYNEDIQYMGQLIAVASRHIDQDEEALTIIDNERLFQPEEERNNKWPWFENDDEFFNQFPTIEKQLFFLLCNMSHYDSTYLPCYKQNFASLCVAQAMCPESKVIARIKQGFADTLADGIYVRKRLAQLYMAVYDSDEEGFLSFAAKFGFYDDFEYVPTPISIDHIMHDMIKASLRVNE